MRPDEISFLNTMSHFGAIFFALALLALGCRVKGIANVSWTNANSPTCQTYSCLNNQFIPYLLP